MALLAWMLGVGLLWGGARALLFDSGAWASGQDGGQDSR